MDMFVVVMTTVEWCMVKVEREIEIVCVCVCVCGGGVVCETGQTMSGSN